MIDTDPIHDHGPDCGPCLAGNDPGRHNHPLAFWSHEAPVDTMWGRRRDGYVWWDPGTGGAWLSVPESTTAEDFMAGVPRGDDGSSTGEDTYPHALAIAIGQRFIRDHVAPRLRRRAWDEWSRSLVPADDAEHMPWEATSGSTPPAAVTGASVVEATHAMLGAAGFPEGSDGHAHARAMLSAIAAEVEREAETRECARPDCSEPRRPKGLYCSHRCMRTMSRRRVRARQRGADCPL